MRRREEPLSHIRGPLRQRGRRREGREPLARASREGPACEKPEEGEVGDVSEGAQRD